MANLPMVNERDVLTSLKNQERLLENIANAITKRDDFLSRKEVKKDKRVIDDQQEKSMIKRIIEAFSGFGKTRLSAQELQLKTLEETKITKSIAQRTGLDIEFIRKSFEDGQKKKDRELLAEAIKSSIGDSGGKSGLASIFAGIGSAILTGLKVITGTIGAAFRSILGVFSIAGLTSIFRAALRAAPAAAVAAAALGSSNTQTDEYESNETIRMLRDNGPGTEAFERNVSEQARDKFYRDFVTKEGTDLEAVEMLNKQTSDQYKEVKDNFFNRLKESNDELLGEYQIVYAEINKKMEDDYAKGIENEKAKLQKSKQKIESSEGVKKEMDELLAEGNKVLDSAIAGITGLANMVGDSNIFETLKSSFASLGTLKFKDGEINLFEGAGDMLGSLLRDATNSYQDEAQRTQAEMGMNTQVNNTNVIGGNSGQGLIPFPNATAVDGHPSLSTYLRSYGAIK